MDIISVNKINITDEHICCAISDKKNEYCVSSKKAWLQQRFEEGLVFKKLNVRGKVFIEYIPAENAWCPIIANRYMFINCFWVSGQFKGQSYANALLNECISDAKSQGKAGIVVLSSKTKKPFLSDPKYLKYKGFKVCDTAYPYYELLYLPFDEKTEKPRFKDCAKYGKIDQQGIVLYYSNQCPHTEKYVMLIQKIAELGEIDLKLIKYQTTVQAQNAPAPFTTYSLFYNGEFVTNEILSEKKFIKFLDEKGL
ncbi:YoaP domain-containing protein [Brassicibacter mesophilus]|uniref:YoaP domain-containing protein n=1 Tax=Brassicibacter mesophilus TaxID=745119 RepID=UPI003D23534D